MSPRGLLRTIVLLIKVINIFGNLKSVNRTQGIDDVFMIQDDNTSLSICLNVIMNTEVEGH